MAKRIIFGSTPIINNYYWNNALKLHGYNTKTVMFKITTFVTKNIIWDINLKFKISEGIFLRFLSLAKIGFKAIFLFLRSLNQFDIVVISFDGFLIGKIPLIWRFQSYIFKALNKKVIVIPYGGDSYVYKNIKSEEVHQGLLDSYPMGKYKQKKISQRVEYWKKHSDVILPGFMHADLFRETDLYSFKILKVPSPLIIDTNVWRSNKKSIGKGQVIEIAHMPNHRGFKGTEKILEVIKELENEGFNIKFHLIEGLPNDEVRKLLQDKIHILIDQIYATGYGLNAIEGMASSCVVMANLSDQRYTRIYEGTYLDECPIISINKSNLKHELIRIILNHNRINDLSKLSRNYVENYHSYKYFPVVFQEILHAADKT